MEAIGQRIVPHLWFDKEAQEAVAIYPPLLIAHVSEESVIMIGEVSVL